MACTVLLPLRLLKALMASSMSRYSVELPPPLLPLLLKVGSPSVRKYVTFSNGLPLAEVGCLLNQLTVFRNASS